LQQDSWRGVVDSPEFLDSPDFSKFVEWTMPIAPSTPDAVRAVAEQWQADIEFDSLDRVGGITAPTLVPTGEHDIVTPPRLGRAVADRIPNATFELVTGERSSHGLMFERPDDFVRTVLAFLEQHRSDRAEAAIRSRRRRPRLPPNVPAP
jgi:pimeloyl-ACP methyl ester carboxylesterase